MLTGESYTIVPKEKITEGTLDDFREYLNERLKGPRKIRYTDSLGHSWDKGTLVTNATCTGEGVMEYRCTRCGYHRIEGNEAAGHVPGNDATCTQPQLCTKCGAVLKNALGHDYKSEVTAPTCTEMGYTTNTCTRCGDTNKTDYTEPVGHKPSDWIVDKQPTTDSEGSKHKECTEVLLMHRLTFYA